MSRRSPRIAALPLQLRAASSGVEIRMGSQDTSHAGWVDQQVADLERNLLIESVFALSEELHLRAFCLGQTGDLHPSGIGSSGLTTIDDGSTDWPALQSGKCPVRLPTPYPGDSGPSRKGLKGLRRSPLTLQGHQAI